MSLKIAVFHNLPSGGALRSLYNKMEQLELHGHHVSLYTFETSESSFLPLPTLTGVMLRQPLNFKGIFRFRAYFRAAKKIAEIINRSDSAIVMVDKCRYFGSPPILQFLNKPCIFYAHEPLGLGEYRAQAKEATGFRDALICGISELSTIEKLKKLINMPSRNFIKKQDRKSIHLATHVFTSSYFTAAWIRRVYGINPVVCYQGADTVFFTPDLKINKKNQLLSVGRIEKRKGHDFLIRVVSRIQELRRPSLIIACDEIDERIKLELEKQASSSGVTLSILYRPSQEELRRLYRSSRLVLCAGVCEPFGLVPLEAMSCGTPVIAMKEGGFLETIRDGKTGYLLERDINRWAEKVEFCLSEPKSMEAMGAVGRMDVITKWNWDDFIDQVSKSGPTCETE